jgi:hypothetical protein
VRDAIEMEWEGIPAVAIVHEDLAGSANAMKKISKMEDYPFIEIKKPLPAVGEWTDEEIDALCDSLVPQIEAHLTGPTDPGSDD